MLNVLPPILENLAVSLKFDIPEIFIAVSSSVFLIFKKNQIPDNRIIIGIKLCNKLGVNSKDKIIWHPETMIGYHIHKSKLKRLKVGPPFEWDGDASSVGGAPGERYKFNQNSDKRENITH